MVQEVSFDLKTIRSVAQDDQSLEGYCHFPPAKSSINYCYILFLHNKKRNTQIVGHSTIGKLMMQVKHPNM